MTRVSISQYEFNNLVEDGIDLIAYFEGRFDEALHRGDLPETAFIPNLKTDICIDGERLGEALAKANEAYEVTAAKSQALHAQSTADRANYRVDELAARIEALEHPEPLKETGSVAYPAKSLTCESGRTYAVRDAMVFPDRGDVAIIFEVEDSPNDTLPVNVFWEKSKCCEWMADAEFENAFKIN